MSISDDEIKCSLCGNVVKIQVHTRWKGKKTVRGIEIFQKCTFQKHKSGGFFSKECPNSKKTVVLSGLQHNPKFQKIRCRYCNMLAPSVIIREFTKNDGWNRPVTTVTTIRTIKLLYHEKLSRKCRGSGRTFKEKIIDYRDHTHP